MTQQSSVTITFGVGANPFAYSPACVKVSPGTQVKFSGTFSSHPLEPGTNCTADTSGSSPITSTPTGSAATFTFNQAGSYGYFCAFHCGSFNMMGAVYVQ